MQEVPEKTMCLNKSNFEPLVAAARCIAVKMSPTFSNYNLEVENPLYEEL